MTHMLLWNEPGQFGFRVFTPEERLHTNTAIPRLVGIKVLFFVFFIEKFSRKARFKRALYFCSLTRRIIRGRIFYHSVSRSRSMPRRASAGLPVRQGLAACPARPLTGPDEGTMYNETTTMNKTTIYIHRPLFRILCRFGENYSSSRRLDPEDREPELIDRNG